MGIGKYILLSFYQWHLHMVRYFVHLKYNPTEAIKFLKIKNMSQIYLIFCQQIYLNDIYFELSKN